MLGGLGETLAGRDHVLATRTLVLARLSVLLQPRDQVLTVPGRVLRTLSVPLAWLDVVLQPLREALRGRERVDRLRRRVLGLFDSTQRARRRPHRTLFPTTDVPIFIGSFIRHATMDTIQALTRHEFYGNTARDWLFAAAIAIVLFGLFVAARRLFIARFSVVAARTDADFDNAVVDLLKRTKYLFLLAAALFLGTRWIEFPDSKDFERVRQAFELIFLAQVGLWATGVVTFLTERFITRRQHSADRFGITAIRALGMGAKLFCWFLVALTAIQLVFGQTASSLLTGLGVGGIALALAVQNILGDLLATLAIAFDRPFDLGDTIGVDAIVGTVEHIGLKTTRIRSIAGEEIVIGNADLLKSRLHNYRRMQERRVVLLVDLSPDTPTDLIQRVPGVLREIIHAQPDVRFDRSHFAGLTDAAFRIETIYYVLDRDYTRFMDAQQAVDLAVVRRLRGDGVRFAFPTRNTYIDPALTVPPTTTAPAIAPAIAADRARSGQ